MEAIGWWLIGIAVLIIVFIGIFFLRERGEGAVEFLKNRGYTYYDEPPVRPQEHLMEVRP